MTCETDLVEIDGSEGEGGGQIIRTAVALSALTGKRIAVSNIRAGRPKPGLANQHLTAIRAVAEICGADLSGDEVGSSRIDFAPGNIKSGRLSVDVGTAGSVGLVLQSCLLALAHEEGRSTLEVRGGTDVKMAPPISYLGLVLFPLLEKMGFKARLDTFERGFYPEGGGRCQVSWTGVASPKGTAMESRGRLTQITGIAYAQNLPEHVPDRISLECKKLLVDYRPVNVHVELSKGVSTGAGVVLCAEFEGTRLGASCLGERGLSSEKVAQNASAELKKILGSTSTLDPHAADQMLPYMALCSGPSSFITDDVTSHLRSQMDLVKRFIDVEIEVKGTGPFLVRVVPNRT